ncbi:STAS domain-containing protein [Streptomyces sp. SP18CS02]|uniref:STAS domain-containing protein n=1 Tax=Streptomyces sp. SP18CS02 TaxID=3002531 RepID=UPI002E78D5B4|nr:STAS domain-containing protein [Streptomyces sp. SP18CS02]MEE1757037.1 STAS domain-containing protein [Streptomyces sp. SP18CS02]
MTYEEPQPLELLATDRGPDVVEIRISGDLDYETADDLVRAVDEVLAARPDVRELALHCGGAGMCDSMGLSALLMVKRRTLAQGVRLRLVERPPALTRLLGLTGTDVYLGDDRAAAPEEGRQPSSGDTLPG